MKIKKYKIDVGTILILIGVGLLVLKLTGVITW